MRLARLDLLRYGLFTDKSIELPRAERDIHIVCGPNEAGKTTCLTAIEDLLFGIPQRSPYNFLHSYKAMRVGAVLEDGDECFEFQRRKSRRDMILGPDGDPLPGDERLLAPFLGGADRVYFDRMFNLSHGRLATGGKAIIEAKDDVGQMLFTAGTGLADLRVRLKRLEEEADRLWAPRKSGRRLYYQAQDRLEEAQSRQRERSLTVSAWKRARKSLRDAEKSLQERRKEHEDTSKALKKLVRIRHVHGAVRHRHELTTQIAALGHVIALAEDAGEHLDLAEQQEAKVRAQMDILAPQLKKNQRALEANTFNEELVRRADEILQLNEQRIAVRSGRQDLPKRRAEYSRELESLRRLAAEIGWNFEEADELIGRIPSRSSVDSVRSLVARHGELKVKLSGAQGALEESQSTLQDKKERLEEIGEAKDVSELAAVLKVVRDVGDVTGRIRIAEGQLVEISQGIERKLRSMKPKLPASTDIEALALPPRDTVVAHRDDMRDWSQRQTKTRERLTEARKDLERDEDALEHRVSHEGVVAPGVLEAARNYRDSLWNLVKARYIAGSEISVEEAQAHAEALEDLPAALEGAVEQADSIADQRFDKAQVAGALAVLVDNIAGHKTRVSQLEADEAGLKAEGKQLDEVWRALWSEVPIELLAPDVMLQWLEVRNDVVTLIGHERDIQRQLENNRGEEQEAIAQIRAALKKLGWDVEEMGATELRVTMERADAFRREQETKGERIVEMRETVRTAKSDVTRRQGDVEKVKAERKTWQANWVNAVAALELDGDCEPSAVSTLINVIDEMREHATTARDLRDKRIATIERDIETFERAVVEVLAELALLSARLIRGGCVGLINSDRGRIVHIL